MHAVFTLLVVFTLILGSLAARKGFYESNAKFDVISWSTQTQRESTKWIVFSQKQRLRVDFVDEAGKLGMTMSTVVDFPANKQWVFVNGTCLVTSVEGVNPFTVDAFSEAESLAPTFVNGRASRIFGNVKQTLMGPQTFLDKAQFAIDFFSGQPVQFWDQETAFTFNSQEDLREELLEQYTSVDEDSQALCHDATAADIQALPFLFRRHKA
uniref:Uncharacterized protein n=1 Tax=Percolomonas cosmopolitus TaxID=63605 RepID=A0A7S1PFW8_9EUKA